MFGRTGILALGVDIAVDELDHCHRRVVAIAEAGLDDAGIATLAVLVAGRQRVEQLLGHLDVAHLTDRLTAHRKAALLAERDQLLHDRAQFLGFRQRGDDLLMLDQRRTHVGEHRAPMLGGAIELPMNPAVTHSLFLAFPSAATVRRTSCSGGLPAFARSFQTSQCGDPESRYTKTASFRVRHPSRLLPTWIVARPNSGKPEFGYARPGMTKSVMILEALGQLVDVLGRPARH